MNALRSLGECLGKELGKARPGFWVTWSLHSFRPCPARSKLKIQVLNPGPLNPKP